MKSPASPGSSGPPADGYAVLAPHYDSYTDYPVYRQWVLGLEALARRHGVPGRRLLDAGCGTGKSFLPLLELGYDVTAADACAEMLVVAAEKAGDRARLVQADLAALPVLGRFDLATCLGDVFNCVLDGEALAGALRGLAANLVPGGLLVFDLTTPLVYRTVFASTHCREAPDALYVWRGQAAADFAPGDVAVAVLEVFERAADGRWRRLSSRHEQRHHPHERVVAALEDAGFELAAWLGQDHDGRRDGGPPDPTRHEKAIYVARRLP